jgi:hypothetical protein
LGNFIEFRQTELGFSAISLGSDGTLRQIISKYWPYGNRQLGYTSFAFFLIIVRQDADQPYIRAIWGRRWPNCASLPTFRGERPDLFESIRHGTISTRRRQYAGRSLAPDSDFSARVRHAGR